jgi:hypothetical protein
MAEYTGPGSTPRALCDRIGLNWLAAVTLHRERWLSFDPAAVARLSPAQRAELMFVGTLVTSGCDHGMLRRLLADLNPPYAYRIDRVYYDWNARTWRMLGTFDGLEDGFEEWVDELVAWREIDRIVRLRDGLERAIQYLRGLGDGRLP